MEICVCVCGGGGQSTAYPSASLDLSEGADIIEEYERESKTSEIISPFLLLSHFLPYNTHFPLLLDVCVCRLCCLIQKNSAFSL